MPSPEQRKTYLETFKRNHPGYFERYRDDHRDRVRASQRKYTQKRKIAFQAWWNEFKRNLKCAQCPETYWACLEFHHRDPCEKDYEISRLKKTLSKTMILREIAKCDVLCANCHRKLHNPE